MKFDTCDWYILNNLKFEEALFQFKQSNYKLFENVKEKYHKFNSRKVTQNWDLENNRWFLKEDSKFKNFEQIRQ